MRAYEIMFILPSSLDDEQADAVVSKYQKLVEDKGGTVSQVDRWGKRRLAYEIDGHHDGNYVVISYQGDESVNHELDRVMKISDDVIRHMITRQDEQ